MFYQLLDPLWRLCMRDQTPGGPEIKLQDALRSNSRRPWDQTPEVNLLKTERSLGGRPPGSKRRLRGRPLRLPQVEKTAILLTDAVMDAGEIKWNREQWKVLCSGNGPRERFAASNRICDRLIDVPMISLILLLTKGLYQMKTQERMGPD